MSRNVEIADVMGALGLPNNEGQIMESNYMAERNNYIMS